MATEPVCCRCGAELPTLSGKSPSFFEKVRDWFTKTGPKEQQRVQLRQMLENALTDLSVSDDELRQLNKLYEESDLSREEFSFVRDQIFTEFVDGLCSDRRISSEEEFAIFSVADRLGFSESALNNLTSNIKYFELLHIIETSTFDMLPASRNSDIVLRRGETDYFTASASLLEERVVNREWVGRSSGFSVPLGRGFRYRIGQNRGHLISQSGVVPISTGQFTVTNFRLIFSGDKKSVNAELSKLLDVELFSDGLRFSLTNRQKPITVQFYDSRSAEIVGLYINRLLNYEASRR